ncbi:MAG TPA: LamG domain-containing protein [Polyangia bacterium]
MSLAVGCKFSPRAPSCAAGCPSSFPFCHDNGLCYADPPSAPGTGGRAGGNGGGAGVMGAGGASVPPVGGSGGGGASSSADGGPARDASVDGLPSSPDAPVDRPVDVPPTEVAPVPDARPPVEVAPPAPVDWPTCATVPAAPALATGLLVHLRLDETGLNPVLTDQSPSKLPASVAVLGSGGSFISGARFGGGLKLNGGPNGSSISVGGTNVLNAAYDAFTFSAWLKFAAGKPADGVVASRRAEGPYGYLYRISISDGRLRVQIHTANGSNANFASDQPLPTDGRWMHVAVTYAINPGQVAIFVNGAAYGAVKFSLQLGPENTSLIVGGADSIVRPPQGTIPPPITIIDRLAASFDEVSFYKRALTPVEVMAIACGVSPVP